MGACMQGSRLSGSAAETKHGTGVQLRLAALGQWHLATLPFSLQQSWRLLTAEPAAPILHHPTLPPPRQSQPQQAAAWALPPATCHARAGAASLQHTPTSNRLPSPAAAQVAAAAAAAAADRGWLSSSARSVSNIHVPSRTSSGVMPHSCCTARSARRMSGLSGSASHQSPMECTCGREGAGGYTQLQWGCRSRTHYIQ
jgi:hypothetical protein